jgi:hypothetical protein
MTYRDEPVQTTTGFYIKIRFMKLGILQWSSSISSKEVSGVRIGATHCQIGAGWSFMYQMFLWS